MVLVYLYQMYLMEKSWLVTVMEMVVKMVVTPIMVPKIGIVIEMVPACCNISDKNS
jgi:hypothetical protein